MRILSAHIFSKSFGGKFNTFEQMLLTETIISKNNLAHAYFLAGKLKRLTGFCPKNNSKNKIY